MKIYEIFVAGIDFKKAVELFVKPRHFQIIGSCNTGGIDDPNAYIEDGGFRLPYAEGRHMDSTRRVEIMGKCLNYFLPDGSTEFAQWVIQELKQINTRCEINIKYSPDGEFVKLT